MERFKVVERETKTKAYSKEGLGGAQKVDPAQKEKDEAINWLSSSIEALNIQIDQFECESESLMIGFKKKKSDKEVRSKQDRLDELKDHIEKHRYHIKQLETLMRMLDNSTIDVDQVKKIKDDVEYYIECCQEPDFEENEFLYSDLNLEGIQEYLAKRDDENSTALSTTPTSTNSGSPSPSPGLTNHSKGSEKKEEDKKRHKSAEENKSIQPVKPVAVRAHNSSSTLSYTAQGNKPAPPTPSRNNSTSSQSSSCSSPSMNSHMNHIVVTPPTTPYAVAAAAASQNSSSIKTHNGPESKLANSVELLSSNSILSNRSLSHPPPSSTPPTSPASQSSPSAASNSSQPTTPSTVNNSSLTAAVLANFPSSSTSGILTSSTPLYIAASEDLTQSCTVVTLTNSSDSSNLSDQVSGSLPQHSSSTILMNGPSKPSLESMSSLKTMAQQAVLNAGLERRLLPPSQTSILSTDRELYSSSSTTSSLSLQGTSVQPAQGTLTTNITTVTTEAHIPPLLGVAPLGPVPLTKDCFYQSQMLEASIRHMPHPSDSERLRSYFPRNPWPTPSYYPQSLPNCDSLDFFQRLSVESLFFIFYYMEGTKAQYLAAKALKKQSWRFHTKYMMWFQRHEEPKTITDEFEQGTYIYFDYEKWGQRKKEGFTFEYRFLEDRDLN
ncbi:CCR4-NOT transcription complex subunit 3-like isoform X2 [Tachypleus tridentatus]|uniref:CCR4-NOT transcription complex subunit 3-like isoform X2 n=1 Tax=Tachypleus tridentatus TaxID=6853 RepID=UPI003FD59191